MADASTTTATPWTPPAATASAAPKTPLPQRLLPAIGPVALFIAWDLVVRLGFIKPIRTISGMVGTLRTLPAAEPDVALVNGVLQVVNTLGQLIGSSRRAA